MNSVIRKKIILAIIRGIQRNGERIFNLSQQTSQCYIPVDKGLLKMSGFFEYLPDGIRLGYMASYSSIVEHGIPNDIPIKGDQIIHMKNGKIRVLHNKRIIYIRRKRLSKFDWQDLYRDTKEGKKPGIFRTISVIKARKGQFYLRRAVTEGFKSLVPDIKTELLRERNIKVQ